MNKKIVGIVFFVVWLSLAAYTFLRSSATHNPAAQQGAAGGSETGAPLNPDINKYNAYIDFQNFVAGRFRDVVNDYESEFGADETIKIDDNFSFLPISLEADALNTAYACVLKPPLYGKADDDLKALYQPTRDLFAIWKEIYDYYKQKNYIDDNFAKGKELHPKFIAAVNNLNSFYSNFFTDMRPVIAKQHDDDLQSLKNHNQMIRYYALDSILKMQAMQHEIWDEKVSAANVLALDMSKFKPFYDTFVDSFNSLNKYADDKKQMSDEGLTDFRFDFYLRSMTDVKVAASEIIDRINKQETVDSMTIAHFVETERGTPEKLDSTISKAIYEYNDVIN